MSLPQNFPAIQSQILTPPKPLCAKMAPTPCAICKTNRALIREMTAKSKVPIEPPQQTKLLDACKEVEGVVGGVVPGAGGYDAIVLLVEDREEVGRDSRARV